MSSQRVWCALVFLAGVVGCDRPPTPVPVDKKQIEIPTPIDPGLPLKLLKGTAKLDVPTDAVGGCGVDAAEFASWFESGAVTANGAVSPADSVAFPDSPNCSFYQWSERMFLWLLSPAPATYGNKDAHVFTSDVFFDVSPPDDSGDRTLIKHSPALLPIAAIRDNQLGPHGLHTVLAADGRLLEVVPAVQSPKGQPLVVDARRKKVAVDRIELDQAGLPRFIAESGEAIVSPRPVLDPKLADASVAVKFDLGGKLTLLDLAGNVVKTEQGMADGAVLMAQNQSLVYYTIAVNDVFAWLRTGDVNGTISPSHFPTNQAELDAILASLPAGTTLPDARALAVEIKGAWIETTDLAHPETYVRMSATIPQYDTTDPKHWVRNGTRKAELALVAIHVVGSANGHPEMIWATFEHKAATPSEAYTYLGTGGAETSVARKTTGGWLFSTSGSSGPFNEPHMGLDGEDIVAVGAFTISPSDTLRMKAWGGASDTRPNPIGSAATHSASSNAEVINMNQNILGMLAPGDVRLNYVMTGASWTIGGQAPTGPFHDSPAPGGAGNEVGTSQLANTTMETYAQGSTAAWDSGVGCFSCHDTNGFAVSHVYNDLKPL